jgi:hypothetical protein
MPAAHSLMNALTRALKDAPTLPRDAAAIALAKRYAEALDALPDDAQELDTLGPKLLRTLESLGMTPAGRSTRGGTADGQPTVDDDLAKLRERANQRRSGSAG